MQETETGASDGETLSKPYAPCGAKEELIIIIIIIIIISEGYLDERII
jgi:hypothetical protein